MLNQNQTNSYMMHEAFEPLIKRVLEARYFGVSRGTMVLNSVTSSGKNKADRFNFSVPYAGQMLEWTVIFNSTCPELGPDFEFHNDSFMADPNLDMIEQYIPSLANWSTLNKDSLYNVFAELTQFYKLHQLEFLGRLDRDLLTEYEMIVRETEIYPEDVEVVIHPNESTPMEARFFIRLAMDFSRLPGRNNKENDDDVMLMISFQQPNKNRVNAQLFLSTQLEEHFGNSGGMHIPPYTRDQCAMKYITQVKKFIAVKINQVATCFEQRRAFIGGFFIMHRQNVVEYDAEDFSRIAILLEQQDFYFLVHFNLPPSFPENPPIVSLQSIYHMTRKDEVQTAKIPQVPYSPRWNPSTMITRILTKVLKEDVPKFKANTTKEVPDCNMKTQQR